MIQFGKGDIFAENSQAIVNPVNTVGVMGKGLALQFRKQYPENFTFYKEACDSGIAKTGKMLVFDRQEGELPRYIVNFPTKQHWRFPSRMEYIEQGLRDLRSQILQKEITSISIPPLGCGLGGLEWQPVRDQIQRALQDLESCQIRVLEP